MNAPSLPHMISIDWIWYWVSIISDISIVVILRIISSASVRRGEPWYRCGAERSEHHGHSVGVRQLLLGERQGEAQLLCGKVDNWELRHAGVSPLFVDSNQGVTQYNVTGAGLLITDFDVWEWGDLVELTGPMKPWRQVTSGPLRSRPLSLFLLSSLSSVKPKSLSIFLRNFPY